MSRGREDLSLLDVYPIRNTHGGCFNTTNRAPRCTTSTSLTPMVCISFQIVVAVAVSKLSIFASVLIIVAVFGILLNT